MAKNIRKLQTEIERNLKSTDEGVVTLGQLQIKLENATTIGMKEKFEADMKKEIKKLQRNRDFFRQTINSGDVKDKSKLQEARKKIENEMEKFREHEKEFKLKKITKMSLLSESDKQGKFLFENEDKDEYDQESNEQQSGSNESDNFEGQLSESDTDINEDKEWLQMFLTDTLRSIMSKYEQELETVRNKKKGAVKKNKEKINMHMSRISSCKRIREKGEELQITIDYLQGGAIKTLKQYLKQFSNNPDEEQSKMHAIQEFDMLIEQSENNRKAVQDQSDQLQMISTKEKSLSDVIDLQTHLDVVKDFVRVEQLQVGNILDAQDYLGNWHLSIVMEQRGPCNRIIHFQPFNKSNRDEEFKEEDSSRIAPAFHQVVLPQEPESSFNQLRQYQQQNSKQSSQNKDGKSQQQSNKFNNSNQSMTQGNSQQPQRISTGKKGDLNRPQKLDSLEQSTSQASTTGNKQNKKQNQQQQQMPFEQISQDMNQGNAQQISMFQGPNPFSALNDQFKQSLSQTSHIDMMESSATQSQQNPFQQAPNTNANFGQQFQQQRDKIMQIKKTQQALSLLDSSFKNMPAPQDQEVVDPKHPVSLKEVHKYPTVPLYNRNDSFAKFDLETLFFAFYYQQGTYQQYLAAVELKKKNWKFNKKFDTWFRKATDMDASRPMDNLDGNFMGMTPQGKMSNQQQFKPQQNEFIKSSNGGAQPQAQKDIGKYVFFDYENGWQQRVADDFEMDLSQIENELVIQPSGLAGGAPTAATMSQQTRPLPQ